MTSPAEPRPPTVTVLIFLAVAVASISGYKIGPPVVEHADICNSMSPIEGHRVDPFGSAPPFELRVLSTTGNCYSHRKSLIVQLISRPDVNNKTWYFEGLFVQARPAGFALPSSDYNHGQFDPLDDRQLQAPSCPGSVANNSLGHREAKRYYNKTFAWTPLNSLKSNVQFVATVVHERDEYWMNVTSPVLSYDVSCVYSAASSLFTRLTASAAATSVVWLFVSSLLAKLTTP